MPKFSFWGSNRTSPPPELAYKRHIGNDFCCPRLHRLCCMRITRTHPNYCLLGQVFWACKTAAQKFGKFSLVYAVAHQFTSVLSRMVEIDAEWMSKRLHSFDDRKNKTRFGGVWWNPWGNFLHIFMWVRTVVPHLYSRFYPNLFRFGGVKTENPFCDPPKWMQYWLFELTIICMLLFLTFYKLLAV